MRSSGCSILLFLLLVALPAGAVTRDSAAKVDPDQLYEEALIRYKQGETEASIGYLRQLLETDPYSLSGHLLLARAYLEQGFAGFAEKEFKVAERLGADRALYVLDLARAYHLQLKFKTLLDDVYPDAFSDSLNAKILVSRGHAFLQLGMRSDAQQAFADALRLDRELSQAYLGQATLLLGQQDFEGSREKIDRAAQLAPQDAEVWYAQGALAHARGEVDQAQEYYRKALRLEAGHYGARLALAAIDLDFGRLDSAYSRLQGLYEDFPENPQLPYLMAIVLAKQQAVEQARERIVEAKILLDRLPRAAVRRHGPTLLLSGLLHFDQKDYDTAVKDLSEYIGRYPGEIRATKLLATIYLRNGAFSKAVEILEKVSVKATGDQQLLVLLGEAYLRQGAHFKAMSMFNRAAELGPLSSQSKTRLGMAQLMIGETAVAHQTLTEVMGQSDQPGAAGMVLVISALQDDRDAEALKVASALHQKLPGHPTITNLLAIAQVANGRYQEARKLYLELLEQQPDFDIARLNLAKLDFAEGAREQALTQVQALLERHPDSIAVMTELARMLLAENQTGRALALLKRAHAHQSNSIEVGRLLVQIYLLQGRPRQALEVARTVVDHNEDHPQALIMLARSHLAMKAPPRAQVALKKAAQVGGYKPELLERIARLQVASGDRDGARYSLEKSKRAAPERSEPRILMAELTIHEQQYPLALNEIEWLRNHQYPAEADRLLGDLYSRQGQTRSALQQYLQALEQSPSQSLALKVFRSYLGLDQEAQGLAFVRQWIQKYPQDLKFQEIMAQGLMRQGKLTEAQQIFERLHQQGVEQPALYNNLALIYLEQRDRRAVELAREAHRLAPESAEVNDTLGWILVNFGQVSEGLKYLRDAHARSARNLEIRFHIAYALDRLERYREALEQLRPVLETPGFEQIDRARKLEAHLRERLAAGES